MICLAPIVLALFKTLRHREYPIAIRVGVRHAAVPLQTGLERIAASLWPLSMSRRQ